MPRKTALAERLYRRQWRAAHRQQNLIIQRKAHRRYRIAHPDRVSAQLREAKGGYLIWGPPITEFYPFIEGQGKLPAMLTAALTATQDLPESIRPDVCQDLIVNMLAGDLEYADLATSIPAMVKKQWGDWAKSLEAPYYEDGTTLRELL